MKAEQRKWTPSIGWAPALTPNATNPAQLVLVFGSTSILKQPGVLEPVRKHYGADHVLGCSTAGEICGTLVSDDSLIATAIRFEHTQLQGARVKLSDCADSFQAGESLARALPHTIPGSKPGSAEKLTHVLTLVDGLKVNGSDFVQGLTSRLPEGVTVTGGMAGDGARFEQTLVFWNTAPEPNTTVALGLYGSRLKVGFGSLGGWDSFGPERLITRSKGNVLYEMDGRSALGLYKKYLGDHAKDLPAAGLLFPLSLRSKAGDTPVVRAILSISEKDQSVTFAGDVPEGTY